MKKIFLPVLPKLSQASMVKVFDKWKVVSVASPLLRDKQEVDWTQAES